MIPELTIALPVLGAATAALWPRGASRPWILPVTSAAHLGACAAALFGGAAPAWSWLALDAPGRVVLLAVTVLFAATTATAPSYLRARAERPNRVFCTCALLVLGALSLVAWSRHVGLTWVGLESATLAAVPLVYFNRNARSIEATWKYLLVGSSGIALALLGTFLLALAQKAAGVPGSLFLEDLHAQAPALRGTWLRIAYVFLLAGWGTKMGLAPMHTWKPDAYGESPGIVGAWLAGGLTNGAFLALARVHGVCVRAGEGAFARGALLGLAVVSIAWAGVFLLNQRNIKRALAYSSVEHMGLLALGVGLSGTAAAGAWLHVAGNAWAKAACFLTAGVLHRHFGSAVLDRVRGALASAPCAATIFAAACAAAAGLPPFATFVSEWTIFSGGFAEGHPWVAGAALAAMAVCFLGMAQIVFRAIFGEPPEQAPPPAQGDIARAGRSALVFAAVLLCASAALTIGMPPVFEGWLHEAAALVSPAMEVAP
jgi:hydrogenase-4 component F